MKQILLKHGGFTIVDDDKFEMLNKWTWRLSNKGYAVRRTTKYVNGKMFCITIQMHRVIIGAKKGEQVDHINSNPLDNQAHNLRLSNQSQNRFNSRKRFDSQSKYKGVFKYRQRPQFWVVRPRYKGKDPFIGNFEDEHIAGLVADLWMIDIEPKFAKPNFKVVAHSNKKFTPAN